jgi:calcineurin-like phosphoesterase family protein/uncharacterized protein YkwD
MFLELRLGPGKMKLKMIISDINKKLGFGNFSTVPHLSLYGDFHTHNVEQVKELMYNIGSKYGYLPFVIDGCDLKQVPKGGYCLALRVLPSESLKTIRNELVGSLEKLAPSGKYWDTEDYEHWFHITVKNNIHYLKFDVKDGKMIKNDESTSNDLDIRYPYLPMAALRLTLLNDSRKIMYEYDFMQKRLMTRSEALDREGWEKTLEIFRLKTGMQLHEKKEHIDKKIFLISDLHLDHKNIIGYCGRPFYDIDAMNKVLVNNWNMTVNDKDDIYFLGDLSYGRGSRPASYWLGMLSGNITFISGNHERSPTGAKDYEILKYKGYEFLLVHDPERIPFEWKGWIIHGHKHNNNLSDYPFINGDKKTINVSAEVIKYKPLDLDYLLSLDINSIKRMDLISSSPERRTTGVLGMEINGDKECEFHSCDKKAVKKCEFCGGYFCDEHIYPFLTGMPNFKSLRIDDEIRRRDMKGKNGHPCIEYTISQKEVQRQQKEEYSKVLDKLRAGSHTKKDEITDGTITLPDYSIPAENIKIENKESPCENKINKEPKTKDLNVLSKTKNVTTSAFYSIKNAISGLIAYITNLFIINPIKWFFDSVVDFTHNLRKGILHLFSALVALIKLVVAVLILLLLIFILNSYIKTESFPALINLSSEHNQSLVMGENCTPNWFASNCDLNNKPLYCFNGKVVNKSDICGCNESLRPYGSECIPIVTCSDGTLSPDCSVNKPYQCTNGTLVTKATVCGCPFGSTIRQDGEMCTDLSKPNPYILEQKVHDLINIERQNNGLSTVSFDDKLADIAREHSQDMISNNYFEHINLLGENPTDRANAAGYSCYKNYGSYYTNGIAENIWQGYAYEKIWYTNGIETSRDWYSTDQIAEITVNSWMSSSGHRQNILTANYDTEGIGVAVSPESEVLITQDFC